MTPAKRATGSGATATGRARRSANGATSVTGGHGPGPRIDSGAAQDAAAATRLVGGRYRLIERLGAGASADVWRARDERDGGQVAVKLLHAWLLTDPVSRARIASEAGAVRRLRHPGIVAVRDLVLGPDEAAIVMDLVSGGTLADRLRRDGGIREREAARITAEIGAALAEAHRLGVVHRDVKPGNVLLDAEGCPRLADFGIARSLDDSQGLTVTGTVMGSLRYMAPEQLSGAPPSPAADVFALGAVLYEMLAGRPAFDATSPGALIDQQSHDPPPIPGVDPRLAAIALAAVRPDPDYRISSALALEGALRAWLAGTPIPAVPAVPSPPARTPVPVPLPRPVTPAPAARWTRGGAASASTARPRPVDGRGARRSRGIGLMLVGLALATAFAAIASAWDGLSSSGSSLRAGGLLGNVAQPTTTPSPRSSLVTPTARQSPVTKKAAATPRPTARQAVVVVRAAPTPHRPAQRPADHGKPKGHGGGDHGGGGPGGGGDGGAGGGARGDSQG